MSCIDVAITQLVKAIIALQQPVLVRGASEDPHLVAFREALRAKLAGNPINIEKGLIQSPVLFALTRQWDAGDER